MSTDAATRVVVVGESLVDIVHRAGGAVDEAPGGSPANVALTLGRLGRAPILVTRLADDDRGRRVRRWLEQSGVAVDAIAAPRTSTATAVLDASGAATYTFDLEWDLGDDVARLAEDVPASADLVHIGSVAAFLEPGAGQVAALVRAVHGRAIITYDPNIRPSLVRDPHGVRARVAEFIGIADVVKTSDEDVQWLHPGRDAIEVAREWVLGGPALVVVTRGAEGAIAVSADAEVVVPAVATDVVDTVGAGDTFMGALIDGLLAREEGVGVRTPGRGIRPDELEALLRRSAAAAAITVSRPGADPPRREELLARTA
ncbi:PfkB family carbohydrate kinase [Microbacterium sp. QXD-8]|uniref:PfkB family carbohydrate kinase n=1 Tax=Microbacterium psychrotolerans TaxID=3068321 RepID=A0ABU0Z1D8_9MICO|nr:PfkB family carbohydrate kinase [Microbacterium sp. QXD-8]MDQ7878393.1 PfkB family carbohydrate kinase [Microbacterium sp. QXD-8]